MVCVFSVQSIKWCKCDHNSVFLPFNLNISQKGSISFGAWFFWLHQHVNNKCNEIGVGCRDILYISNSIKSRFHYDGHKMKAITFTSEASGCCVNVRTLAKTSCTYDTTNIHYHKPSDAAILNSWNTQQAITNHRTRQTFGLINKINFYGVFYCIVLLMAPFFPLSQSPGESKRWS